MAVNAHQHIVRHSVEDVMFAVGEVAAFHLLVEAQTFQLAVYLLLGGQSLGNDKRLAKHGASFAVAIFGKPRQLIGAVGKVVVVGGDTLEEGCEIVVRITKIVEFDSNCSIIGYIDFVFRTTVRISSTDLNIVNPTLMFFGPIP